jgi:hypothetical protein
MEAALWPTLADAAQVLETRGGPRRPRPDAVPYACIAVTSSGPRARSSSATGCGTRTAAAEARNNSK